MNAEPAKPAPSMVTAPAAQRSPDDGHEIMQRVLLHGDLSKLSAAERNQYYMETCHSLGLNPLTRPFEYLVLNGKLTLYARRDGCDQLRKRNNISLEVVSQKIDGDLMCAHVRATAPDGRRDEDYGVVALGQLKGDARANAIMKAITKGKRRVTLSICGLGMPDETEVEDIPARDKLVPPPERDVADPKPDRPDRSRDIYAGIRAEIDALVDSGISPEEFYQWGADNEPRVREMSGDWANELRHYWLEKYKEVQQHWEEFKDYKLKHEDAPQNAEEIADLLEPTGSKR